MTTALWRRLAERFENLGDTSPDLHALVWHNPPTQAAWEIVPPFDTFGRIDSPIRGVRNVPWGEPTIGDTPVLATFTNGENAPDQWRVVVFGRDTLNRLDTLAHETLPHLPPVACPDARPWHPLGLLLTHAAQVVGVGAWAQAEAGVWRQRGGDVIVCDDVTVSRPVDDPNSMSAVRRVRRSAQPTMAGGWVAYLPSASHAVGAFLRQLEPPPRMRFDDDTGTIYLDGKEVARNQPPDVVAYFKQLWAAYPNPVTFSVMKENDPELTNDTRTQVKMPASLKELFSSTIGKGKALVLPPSPAR